MDGSCEGCFCSSDKCSYHDTFLPLTSAVLVVKFESNHMQSDSQPNESTGLLGVTFIFCTPVINYI